MHHPKIKQSFFFFFTFESWLHSTHSSVSRREIYFVTSGCHLKGKPWIQEKLQSSSSPEHPPFLTPPSPHYLLEGIILFPSCLQSLVLGSPLTSTLSCICHQNTQWQLGNHGQVQHKFRLAQAALHNKSLKSLHQSRCWERDLLGLAGLNIRLHGI